MDTDPVETTSLLSTREPYVRYNSARASENGTAVNLNSLFSQPQRHTWNPRQLKQLTVALAGQIGQYKRRSGTYDEDKQALVNEGSGIRVWYDDYTTIGNPSIYFNS